MTHVRRFDHVGITVADLDTVTMFFVGPDLALTRPSPHERYAIPVLAAS